jgi:GT2 family glycosyltransferase
MSTNLVGNSGRPRMLDLLTPVVAIPARNEEALLPRFIAALGRQTILDSLKQPLAVVLVLNNITDGSLRAADAAAVQSPRLRVTIANVVYPTDRAHVGSARRHALDLALDIAPSGVLLTTDADAVPSDDWAEANLRAIAAGADIVGGRIIGDPREEALLGPGFQRRAALHARYADLRDELAALIDPLPYDPWPRHHDHTGGSLAVRSSTYRQVGGMDALPFREDIAFVSKVRAAGFRLVHPLDVLVTVSARTTGRAKGGMAECIATWLRDEAEGTPAHLECPSAVESRLRRRSAFSALAKATPDAARRALAALGIDPELAGTGRYWLADLIERYAPDELDAPGTVLAHDAIAALAQRIAVLRGMADAA